MNRLPFLDPVRDDLERVEILLREQPPGRHEAIGVAMDHLVGGGGKRLRPALVLLSAHLCQADIDRAVFAAAATEMLHTATLIHDDLIDASLIRRGMETLNTRWTPGATVLTGDYVFARAAYLASQSNSIRLMKRFAETLMVICNGEIRQLFDGRHGQTSRHEYEQRICAKTASLIAMSAESGAILADAGEKTTGTLRTYGERLGLAFQIVDDVLDFVADEATLGKPVGSDLQQGLITLPVLFFLKAEPDHPALQRALAQSPSKEMVQEAVRVVAASPAIKQALEVARWHADQAKEALNRSQLSSRGRGQVYSTALLELADFTVRRHF